MTMPYVMFMVDWLVNGFNIGYKWSQYIQPEEETCEIAESWLVDKYREREIWEVVNFHVQIPFSEKLGFFQKEISYCKITKNVGLFPCTWKGESDGNVFWLITDND